MKSIISKLVTITPVSVIILILAYVIEEAIKYGVSKLTADLVYPIAAVIILAILWIYLVPTIQSYLKQEDKS
jgi:hypothetical protein